LAIVIFAPQMRQLLDGLEQVEVQARNYRALLRELSLRYPALDQPLFDRFVVAIDGELIHSPLLETLEPDSEVVFVQRIAAG
jgi:hypothetical protein